MITPVILAGGLGARLWPLSTNNLPKQFQSVIETQSLLSNTLKLVDRITDSKVTVICNNSHRFITAEQLDKNETNCQLLVEPNSKNTLPAITIGCLAALKGGHNPLVLILPSDHSINNKQLFIESIQRAADSISEDQIVTFGVKPTRAETGFGYLKLKNSTSTTQHNDDKGSLIDLSEFVEKPDFDLANHYFNSNQYMWNSGIYLASAMTFIELARTYQKSTYESCVKAYNNSIVDLDFIRLESSSYSNCPSISFDNGVMELLCSDPKRKVTPLVMSLDCGWDDLGAWDAIHRLNQRRSVHCSDNDSECNSILSDAVLVDTSDCLVKSDSKLITMLGMKDTIVIDTKNALLVANMDRAQEVKELVSKLEKLGKEVALQSSIVYRPWGRYEILVSSENHQIKKVIVEPGKRISLQKHFKRAEHWVVVSGVATVTCGNKVTKITKNESTYIPVEKLHRLENNEEELLELIEVQTGDYFGEDDIERFDDEYGRV